MATSASAHLHMLLEVEGIPNDPLTGVIRHVAQNVLGGRRWTQGISSGQVDRIYVRERAGLGLGATDSYNFLAAGSLTDIHGQAIDLDELKALFILPTSGGVRLDAPAAAIMPFFTDATDLLIVPAGGLLMDFGAAGLSIAAAASIDVTNTSGAVTADYTLVVIGAQ